MLKKPTEILIFCLKQQDNLTQRQSINVQNDTIQTKTSVKYLGVLLDQHFWIQEKVKSILKKMACGMRTGFCQWKRKFNFWML